MTRKVYTYYSRKQATTARKKKKRAKGARSGKKKTPSFKGWMRRSVSFMFIGGVLIVLMILYNLQYALIEKDLVEIRQLKKDIRYMQNQKTQLLVDVKRLKHVNRINKLAMNQLGLVPYSEKPKVLVVDKDLVKEAREKDRMLHAQGS